MAYFGDVLLGETLYAYFQAVDASGTPADSDFTPSIKIYDGTGLVQGVITPTFAETAVISAVSNPNAVNCVVSSTAHGLMAGQVVNISGVTGHALSVNARFLVVSTTTDTFTINLTGNNGAAGTGGSWHTSGLYKYSIAATEGNGYESGMVYTAYAAYAVSSVSKAQVDTFLVV